MATGLEATVFDSDKLCRDTDTEIAMGKTKGRYNAEYAEGSLVRIADRPSLEQFKRDWRWHNPLQTEQLEFGGRLAKVKSIGFYHGGDELYELEGIPGVWHEGCLRGVEDDTSPAAR